MARLRGSAWPKTLAVAARIIKKENEHFTRVIRLKLAVLSDFPVGRLKIASTPDFGPGCAGHCDRRHSQRYWFSHGQLDFKEDSRLQEHPRAQAARPGGSPH